MVDLGGGIVTDGQYTYRMDENGPDSMLSLDRPSVNAGNIPPADDTDSVMRYSQSLRPGQGVGTGGGPSLPPPPPQREFVSMPKLKMGQQMDPSLQFIDVGPSSWSDPNYGAQNKVQYRSMIEALLPLIRKNNPGLYTNTADFTKDVDAIMAGNPNLYKPRPVTPVVAPKAVAPRTIQPQTKQPAVILPKPAPRPQSVGHPPPMRNPLPVKPIPQKPPPKVILPTKRPSRG